MFWVLLFNTISALASPPATLVVGDSHVFGPMGRELVRLLDESKPTQPTSVIASCGATPEYFFKGTSSHCGVWTKLLNTTIVDTAAVSRTFQISAALSQAKPSRVIVVLGTNLAPRCKGEPCYPDETVQTQVQLLLSALPQKTSCAWVGIPKLGKISNAHVAHINSLIANAVKSRCKFVDSFSATTYPKNSSDPYKIHYLGPEAVAWANFIYSKL